MYCLGLSLLTFLKMTCCYLIGVVLIVGILLS
jgi:hypothetical protein